MSVYVCGFVCVPTCVFVCASVVVGIRECFFCMCVLSFVFLCVFFSGLEFLCLRACLLTCVFWCVCTYVCMHVCVPTCVSVCICLRL